MAKLTDKERREVWARIMRDRNFPPEVLKRQLRAAVDACDDWIEANLASFNASLPPAFRQHASNKLKIILLTFVLRRKMGNKLDFGQRRKGR